MTRQTQPITGGSKGVIDSGDGVADGDAFGSDEDFSDHGAQHLSAGFDGGSVGGFAESGEETFEALGQLEVAVPVEELGLEGVGIAVHQSPPVLEPLPGRPITTTDGSYHPPIPSPGWGAGVQFALAAAGSAKQGRQWLSDSPCRSRVRIRST